MKKIALIGVTALAALSLAACSSANSKKNSEKEKSSEVKTDKELTFTVPDYKGRSVYYAKYEKYDFPPLNSKSDNRLRFEFSFKDTDGVYLPKDFEYDSENQKNYVIIEQSLKKGHKLSFTKDQGDRNDGKYSFKKEITLTVKKNDGTGLEKSASSSSSASSKTSTSSNSTTSTNPQVFDNDQVTISYNSTSNYFTVKNKTAAPITLGNGDGPILNGHLLNMYDGFASVSVPANASVEENVKLENSGETLGGDKLHEYDYVQEGDNVLHVAGEISDEDYNTIGSYSFDVNIKSSLLKK